MEETEVLAAAEHLCKGDDDEDRVVNDDDEVVETTINSAMSARSKDFFKGVCRIGTHVQQLAKAHKEDDMATIFL